MSQVVVVTGGAGGSEAKSKDAAPGSWSRLRRVGNTKLYSLNFRR